MSAQFRNILIFLLVFPWLIFGQKVYVHDAQSGRGIPNVFVYSKDSLQTALSIEGGILDLSRFKMDDSIVFQHTSYMHLKDKVEYLVKLQHIFLNPKTILFDDFIVSASKQNEHVRDIPTQVSVLVPADIKQSFQPTAADLLLETGQITVQKSQGGGGSPILRGFEANKVLLVLDGVRLNNAIYRSGHLQNAITIDMAALENVEVVYGPNAVMYGSDALGGVISYNTKSPVLSMSDTSYVSLDALARYTSANKGTVYHANFNLGYKKWGHMLSISRQNYGDIRIGTNNIFDFPENFGSTSQYVSRIDGKDSILNNPFPEIQPRTDYQQLDLNYKTLFKPDENRQFQLHLNFTTSSNIHRYDELFFKAGETPRLSTWYYGPQERFLGAFHFKSSKANRWFDQQHLILSYQKINEDRITRAFEDPNEQHQNEDLHVTGFTWDLKKGKQLQWSYGVDAQYNDLISSAYFEDITNGSITDAPTRYPHGQNYMLSMGAYATHKHHFSENRFLLRTGLRYSYSWLYSNFSSNLLYDLPFDEVRISNGALTGSVGLIWKTSSKSDVYLNMATGFRNPNIDDYGKIRFKADVVTIPNQNLGPEYSFNTEIGYYFEWWDRLKWQGAFFVNILENAIVRQGGSIDNNDSIVISQASFRVTQNMNAFRALVSGFNSNVQLYILHPTFRGSHSMKLNASINYTLGEILTTGQPLGHIPPIFGHIRLTHRWKILSSVFTLRYNGFKDISRFSPFGEDNELFAPAQGSPAWYTLNYHMHIKLDHNLNVSVGMDNILNAYYRTFASGVSAPGRNLLVSLQLQF